LELGGVGRDVVGPVADVVAAGARRGFWERPWDAPDDLRPRRGPWVRAEEIEDGAAGGQLHGRGPAHLVGAVEPEQPRQLIRRGVEVLRDDCRVELVLGPQHARSASPAARRSRRTVDDAARLESIARPLSTAPLEPGPTAALLTRTAAADALASYSVCGACVVHADGTRSMLLGHGTAVLARDCHLRREPARHGDARAVHARR
jgi:hypothetical protein